MVLERHMKSCLTAGFFLKNVFAPDMSKLCRNSEVIEKFGH